MSGIHSQGGSNKLIYDNCDYNQWYHDTTSPYEHVTYEGKFENCGKCREKYFLHPYDLVDVESELRNQTRPASRCGSWKYNPNIPQNKCVTTNTKNGKKIEKFVVQPNGTKYPNIISSTTRCDLNGISTFDKSVPVMYPPEICPIVHNNIPKTLNKGFSIPDYIQCKNYQINNKGIIFDNNI
jgi:hypothetical protein